MPSWKCTLRLADIFHSEAHSFTNRRDIIVKRIKALPIYDEDDFAIWEIVENLAETEDVDQFNGWWNEFYDWADSNRVWVETR
jgi:hypothetical protein